MTTFKDGSTTSTTRNEFSFMGKSNPAYIEGYFKCWVKLPNLKALVSTAEYGPWYLVTEWKEISSGIKYTAEQCSPLEKGGSNNYRINFNVQKKSNSDLFQWYILAEHPQPCREIEWTYMHPTAAVPLDEWFLMEGYMKKHATDGRVYLRVNGEVILDTDVTKPVGFTGRTQHADNPLYIGFWSPLKNYHNFSWNEDNLRVNGTRAISQFYDDFELWNGFPPGHPGLGGSNPVENYSEYEENSFFYPNPAQGMVYFKEESDVRIITIDGIEVLNAKRANQIDVSRLAPGLYFVKDCKGKISKMVIG